MEFSHIPILLDKCIELLDVKPYGTYVDCTLGGGGHSSEILKRLTTGKLIAIDKDTQALEFCKKKFAENKEKIIYAHSDYENAVSILDENGFSKIDGVLMDLGVSSYQLDNNDRGFSYMTDASLDMRMDTTQSISAFNVVNEYSEQKLFEIIRDYGEDKFAKNIAKNIVIERAVNPIETTLQLVKVIDKSIPYAFKKDGHPAKRTFQAIRIEVNGELSSLEKTIRSLIERLSVNGTMVILTFHSLEDRIVKNVFRDLSTGCICPKSLPVCVCNHKATVMIAAKNIEADENEIKLNSRAKSAKLRAIKKVL